jgi:hypothetical protein
MRADYAELGLLQGDRLEPSKALRDVGSFETQVVPFEVTFWRPQNETACKHRCSLFAICGVSVETLAIDALHTLNLGVYKSFCQAAIWQCIEADVWKIGTPNAEVLLSLSCGRLKQDLLAWYRRQRRDAPHVPLYEISDFTPSMVGTHAHKCLATKAAETGTLVHFCRDLVAEHRARLGVKGVALLAVGNSLHALQVLMRESPRRLSAEQAQGMVDHAKAAAATRAAADVPFSPKWHLMLHLVSKAWRVGNPSSYSTFLDEGLNGALAKIGASSFRGTWYNSVLGAFRWKFHRSMRWSS